jgi:hypothetical protein
MREKPILRIGERMAIRFPESKEERESLLFGELHALWRWVRSMIQRRFNRLWKLAITMLISLCWPTAGQATLYVIVLNRQGIAIASDSRRMMLEGGQIKTLDGVEKVIALGTRVAFMSSGLTEISTATSTIRPSQLVRTCYANLLKGGRRVSIKDLSTAYAKLATEHLNRLSDSEKAAVASLVREFGSQNNQVMESIITGIDIDGSPRVETIDFYLSRPSLTHAGVLRFEWSIDEAMATEVPRVILSGEVGVLRSAFQDGATPISELPSVQACSQAMHEGKQVNAAQSAEALLNLAIEYSPPGQTRLGYPIFVYTLNQGSGLRKIRTVPKGKAVDLPH